MEKKVFLKFISVLLAVAAAFFVTACAKKPNDTEKEEPVSVRIGSDYYAPYFYKDENGEFAGIDVELATEACKRIGRKAEFIEIEWSHKNVMLESGELDCLWGSFSMTGREDLYAWAGPYLKSRQVFAVKEDSNIYSFADLEGKIIALQATSKADEILSSGKDPRIPVLNHIYCFTDFEHIYAALKNGYVDAIASHEVAIRERMKSVNGNYRILEESILDVELGAAFKKNGGEELAERIETALKVMRNDGFIESVVKAYGLNPEKVLTERV